MEPDPMVDIPPAPAGFAQLNPDVYRIACEQVWLTLTSPNAVGWLSEYYDPTSDYAGATFVEMLDGPTTSPDVFTAADLYSVTLLSVDPPSPLVTRRFLDPGASRNQLNALLTSDALRDVTIAQADEVTMYAMRDLYECVKVTLGKNPWVTASKLCARKRPDLFPVRDTLTRARLDLLRHGNYELDWQVFRLLMSDKAITDKVYDLRDAAAGPPAHLDAYPLRWLDVLLWRRAKEGGRD